MQKNEEILVLEINGKKNVVEYQKTLYEAAVLGISHVMFVIAFDDSEKHNNNINAMFETILKTCEVLGIEESNTRASVYGGLGGTSVGTMNERGNVQSFCSLKKFSSYKERKQNSEKLIAAESFEDVYEKKLKLA